MASSITEQLMPKTRLDAEKYLKNIIQKSIQDNSEGQEDFLNMDLIISILKQFKSIKITKFKSVNFILHSVKEEKRAAFYFFLDYFTSKGGLIEQGLETEQTFISYLNQSNKVGFSALSYAAYFEFEDFALKLIELGADYSYINADGDSVMVLAVKGGSMKVLMKLQELGQDVFQKKNNNLSLLHFACYEGNLHIVKYLLKINELEGGNRFSVSDIDQISGETPLHMAVNSGEYPIVKYLLINKANKTLRCKSNMTAYDKALQLKKSKQISGSKINGIISLLGKIPLKKRFQLQTRVGPIKRFNTYSFMMLVINAIGFIGTFLVLPFVDRSTILVPIFVLMEIISISLLWLTRSNPGYIDAYGHKNFEEGQNEIASKKQIFMKNFSNLLRFKEYEDICIECCIIKPLRSKHCDFCRKCVSVMDHHCPFVGNCIGSKNHKYFFFMLLTQMLSQIFNLCICIMFYVKRPTEAIADYLSNYLIQRLSVILVRDWAICFTIVLILDFLITIFPLFFMLQHQLSVLLNGMTSIELRFQSKYHFNKQAALEFDNNIPVTDPQERTKSKQFIDTNEFKTGIQEEILDNSTFSDSQLSFSQSTVELNNFHITKSRQQEINYNKLKQKSKITNMIDLLFKNCKNPKYFASELLHQNIFLGKFQNSQLKMSFTSELSMNHSRIDMSQLIQ